MSSITFEHLIGLLFNRAHCVHPDKLVVMVDALAGRTGIAFDPEEGAGAFTRIDALQTKAQVAMRGPAKSNQAKSEKPFATSDGVAIIPIKGTLINRGSWLGPFSGVQTYEGIKFQLRAALDDEDVKAVLLDVDSGGGQAAGASKPQRWCANCAPRRRLPRSSTTPWPRRPMRSAVQRPKS